MHKVVLYGISDNLSALFHNVEYGAINTSDLTTMGYYVVKYLSEPYMLQDKKNFDKKVINVSIMESNTNWYWQQLGNE